MKDLAYKNRCPPPLQIHNIYPLNICKFLFLKPYELVCYFWNYMVNFLFLKFQDLIHYFKTIRFNLLYFINYNETEFTIFFIGISVGKNKAWGKAKCINARDSKIEVEDYNGMCVDCCYVDFIEIYDFIVLKDCYHI